MKKTILLLALLLLASCQVVEQVKDDKFIAEENASMLVVNESSKSTKVIDNVKVIFRVHVPKNTNSQDTIFLVIKNFDSYFTDNTNCPSTAEYGCRRIPLLRTSPRIWEAEVDLLNGSLARYVYDRGEHRDEAFLMDIGGNRESFDENISLFYRYLYVAPDTKIVEDTVVRWEDISQEVAREVARGKVKGKVVDKITGEPLMDITVSIAGVHFATDYKGEFEWKDIPLGKQIVTISTETGKYKYASKEIEIKRNEVAEANFELELAKKTKVTFNVKVPDYTPDFAKVRISGNIYQLGAVWWYRNLLFNSPLRYVEMEKSGENIYSLTLDLYEGTYLEYSYHLGKVGVNGPVDSYGTITSQKPFVVKREETVIDDKISRWSRTISSQGVFNISPTAVTLYVETPESTPTDEAILVGGGCSGPHTAMYQLSPHRWALPLFDHSYGGSHRYLRGIAAPPVGMEEIDKEDICKNREGPSPRDFDGDWITLNDTIKAWRWDAEVPDYSFSVVPVKKREFFGAVDLLDFYDPDFITLYWSTFNHLEKKGIKWVAIPTNWQYSQLEPLPELEPRGIKLNFLGIPTEDLRKIVREAHKRGFKVVLYMGTVSENTLGNIFNRNSNEWYEQWFKEEEKFMLYHAKIAEELGVEMVVLPRTSILSFEDESYKETFNKKMKDLIKKFKQEYSGLITSEEDTYTLAEKYNFFTEMDYLGVLFDHGLDLPDDASVEEIEEKFAALLDERYKPISEQYGKPFIFTQVHYPSVSDALSKGGAAANLASNEPDNDSIKLDLELQARIYEGLFRTIAKREWVVGVFPFSYNLINQPGTKSFDIRGKPAEEVFAAYSKELSE